MKSGAVGLFCRTLFKDCFTSDCTHFIWGIYRFTV
nr:MAG TPA: hypothetical protein [Caudoviricetes sp.]